MNLYGSCQGTTLRLRSGQAFSRAEQGAEKVEALAPANKLHQGLKLKFFVGRLAARLKAVP